jgi:NhaP-type Na+/H+ or K+/H+ antiporter
LTYQAYWNSLKRSNYLLSGGRTYFRYLLIFYYKIKLPAILPLLIAGIIVGLVTGIINADLLFGYLLFPIAPLSASIILFEGSMPLKFKDLGGHGSMVRNLCTVGVLNTWIIAVPIAHYAMGMPWEMAFLFGAIVTVTEPTLLVSTLRTVRPSSKVATTLRWEGIFIYSIGALLVFEYIVSTQSALSHSLFAFATTI